MENNEIEQVINKYAIGGYIAHDANGYPTSIIEFTEDNLTKMVKEITQSQSDFIKLIEGEINSPDRFKRKAGYNEALTDLINKLKQ